MEPRIDKEPEIMHPGPEITSLLMQQTNHQSEIIWNGEVKYLVLTTALIFTKRVSLLASSFKVVYLILTTAIIFINFARPGPISVPWSL